MPEDVNADGGGQEATPLEESSQETTQPVEFDNLVEVVVAKLAPHVTAQVRQAIQGDLTVLHRSLDKTGQLGNLERRAQRTEAQVATLLKTLLPEDTYKQVTAELEADAEKATLEARVRTSEQLIRQLTTQSDAPLTEEEVRQRALPTWQAVAPVWEKYAAGQGLTWAEAEPVLLAIKAPDWEAFNKVAEPALKKLADGKHREETPAPNAATTVAGGARGRPDEAYRQALKEGKPLPPAHEIDAITAGWLAKNG